MGPWKLIHHNGESKPDKLDKLEDGIGYQTTGTSSSRKLIYRILLPSSLSGLSPTGC